MLNLNDLMMLCDKDNIGSSELLNELNLKLTFDNYKTLKKEMEEMGCTYVKPTKGKVYYKINEMGIRKAIAQRYIENYSFYNGKYELSYY